MAQGFFANFSFLWLKVLSFSLGLELFRPFFLPYIVFAMLCFLAPRGIRSCLLLMFFIWGNLLLAQIIAPKDNPTDEDNDLQYIIENAVEAEDGEEFTFDTQFENLEELLRNPLDLNRSSEADLVRSGLFTALQVQALLEYRRRFGQIYTIYELVSIPGFDRITVFRVLPYVDVDESKTKQDLSLKQAFRYGRNQMFFRHRRVLQRARGFQPLGPGETGTRFEGSPDQFYFRHRFTFKDRMSFGITAEKDPGEAFFRASNPQGFDFYSAHFYLRDVNPYLKTLALGDYQVFLGQGLTMWGGFGIRKNPNVLNVKRMSEPIRAYTSANEALFQRGAAAQLSHPKYKQWDLVVFASYRRRDGNINQIPILDSLAADSLEQDFDELPPSFAQEISSLPIAGLHRTPTEIAQKNTLGVTNTGGALRYRGGNWTVAANVSYVRFDQLLNLQNRTYQAFWFNGRGMLNGSLDYTYMYKNIQFFGETALGDNGGFASLNGLLLDLDPKVKMAFLHRHYGRDYVSLFANAFGETQRTNNETGFYSGLELYPMRGLKISTFFDVFRHPWLRYLVDGPSHGYEFFGRAEYQVSRNFNVYAQYRIEEKGRNLQNRSTNLDRVVNTERQNFRIHLNARLNDQWTFRSRLEFSSFGQMTQARGVVLYQDLAYRFKHLPMSVNGRVAFFETDNYDARIYAYESDVLYQFSVPAYYGRGIRFYINWQFRPWDRVTIWLRFANTYFDDREVISSGLNRIDGRNRSEIKAQLRYKF